MHKPAALVALIFLTFVNAPFALAAESPRTDGTWWRTLSAEQKTVAVQSLVAGYRMGFFFGYLMQAAMDAKTTHNTKLLIRNPHRLSFQAPFKTYVDDITRFYLKHPDLVKLDVSNLIDCMGRSDFSCDAMAQNIHRFHLSPGPP